MTLWSGALGIGGRLSCLKIELLRVSPSSFCLKEEQLQAARDQIKRSSWKFGNGSSLSVFDSVKLQWWQLLEFTTLAVGHLQGRPQAMGPVPAMLPSSPQHLRINHAIERATCSVHSRCIAVHTRCAARSRARALPLESECMPSCLWNPPHPGSALSGPISSEPCPPRRELARRCWMTSEGSRRWSWSQAKTRVRETRRGLSIAYRLLLPHKTPAPHLPVPSYPVPLTRIPQTY